jgi:hypothetical protein
LAALILRLAQIRDQLGEALSVSKLRDDLRKIIDDRRRVSEALTGIVRKTQERLFAPTIKPAAAVALAPGGKAAVKHAVDWNVFDKGEIKVRVEAPAGLTGPGELTVKDDVNDFEYELTAGDKPGDYTVRLVPSVGEPVVVRVTVR